MTLGCSCSARPHAPPGTWTAAAGLEVGPSGANRRPLQHSQARAVLHAPGLASDPTPPDTPICATLLPHLHCLHALKGGLPRQQAPRQHSPGVHISRARQPPVRQQLRRSVGRGAVTAGVDVSLLVSHEPAEPKVGKLQRRQTGGAQSTEESGTPARRRGDKRRGRGVTGAGAGTNTRGSP